MRNSLQQKTIKNNIGQYQKCVEEPKPEMSVEHIWLEATPELLEQSQPSLATSLDHGTHKNSRF